MFGYIFNQALTLPEIPLNKRDNMVTIYVKSVYKTVIRTEKARASVNIEKRGLRGYVFTQVFR